ncbi:MAG: hypothetical protein ACKPFK_31905, partial [Dolichospermum sp.]
MKCGYLFAKWTGDNGRVFFSTLAARKSTRRRCSDCEAKMTVIEFFEKCENYSSSNAVWAEKATSESELLVGEIPNNS